MAGAAGGFVTRSFESMLKESKKYGALQKAIQAYLDCSKEDNNQSLSASAGQSNVTTFPISEKVTADFEIVGEGKYLQSRTSVPISMEQDDVSVESLGTGKSIMTALASAGNILEGAQYDIVIQPLRLAFETKNTKLVELALDCLHKLIAYDHLEGDPGIEDGKNASLLTDILNLVCNCVDNSSPDSTVLQVLKVLLTVVSSAKFRVHGELLLGVIRLCYSICIKSKSPINQATSKAMLTQIINIIFRRMESNQTSVFSSSRDSNPLHADASSTNNRERTMDDQDHDKTNQGDPLLMKGENEESHAYIEKLQSLAINADIKKLEDLLDKAVSLENENKVQSLDINNMGEGEHDALLIFRTLCKMAMMEETDEVTTRTRHLSLELLQGLLEDLGDSFTKNFQFINSLKAYLSYALLRACVSSSVVFQYAAGIFAVLLLKFRESLKGEIGIFFPLIVLRSLDSSHSSLSQRTSVLRMLEKVSKDSQTLVDIFLNYDCDLEAPNLFERMVGALSRISQLMPNTDPNSVVASQISSIKTSSLQCLVTVMTSLVNWEKSQKIYLEYKYNMNILSVDKELSTRESIVDESENGAEVPNNFEKAKDHRPIIESAISEFNKKPSKGIELLISHKLVDNTANSVAQFLKNTPTLDKAVIGEYFGQHEEFPLAVMHAYVDSMNFTGMKFDSAFREFLRGFQLPWEAQKIDRIMEKFAERYCADNPGLLKNADAAYTLAYSVIMLNIHAHNPNIWPKMTRYDFVCMNSMDNGQLCASKELLEEIYDSIVKQEIKMKNDVSSISRNNRQMSDAGGSLVNVLNLSIPRRKTTPQTTTKSEDIVKQMQKIFRKREAKNGTFYSVQQIELVKPMLEAVGWPLLAAFSVMMEDWDDKERVLLCMEGFRYGIHITYILGMDTMRFAFLTSLIRLTFLHSPKQLQSKNVEALRALLALCNTESDSLQDTWNAVLECISRLDFIISTPFIASSVMQGSNQISRDPVLQSLRELGGKPAEQVFVHSVKLPSDLVVEFFTALCGISAEELKQIPARVYSLQKLVEISYYNMARIHLVWARIWSVLSYHFISAGSHHEERISMYAVDSLRKLGMKYLERDELKNFSFQNDILKPFVILMRNSQSESIRGLIVDCIVQMIKLKDGGIKSGWKSIFTIFTLASNDKLEPIIESAFENVEQAILEHFDQLLGDCFMDCVNCLIGFANNKTSSQISLKAIALLRICENRLAEGLIPEGALRLADDGLDSNVDVTERYWFPMLAGLSELTLDLRVEVRNCALEVLFDLLNERGWIFSSAFWENIFHRVLFPIFDIVRHSERDIFTSSRDEWLRDTIIHSLQLLCNLFNTFYKDVFFMLPSLLNLLLDCAKKTDQSVVSISLGALVHLVEVGGHQFSTNDWDTLLRSIRVASYTTQPLELHKSFKFDNLKDQIELATEANADRGGSTSMNKSHFGSGVIEATFDQASLSSDGESEGREQETSEPANVQMSQTFGQRIIGNIFLKSLTSKSNIQPEDFPSPSSPSKINDSVDTSHTPDEEENHTSLKIIRGKCITQLLLLDVLNCIQKRYWDRLNPTQKITTMEVILSVLEFASSFNSYRNLRMRMRSIPSGRPPVNIMRQEMKGTTIYLDILQKTTKGYDIQNPKHDENDASAGISSSSVTCCNEISEAKHKLKLVAEEKLVSFCKQMLKDASELHFIMGDAANVDIHRVLELRSPIIVKVLKGMCNMDSKIFQNHLTEFYPLITKLVCCEQMEIRGALADLFSEQLTHILS